MKKRVVILSTFLTPHRHGAEACVEEIAQELSAWYDVIIVTARLSRLSPKNDTIGDNVPVVRIGFGFMFDKWLFPFLAPLVVRSLKPDLIHAVLESFAGIAMITSSYVSSAKRVLTCQTTNTNFKGMISSSFLVKKMHKNAHKVTVISKALLKRAEQFGVQATLIPNGLRVNDIPSGRNIFGRILFAGRLEPMKGIDTLLKAMVHMPAHAHLHIVGDGSLRYELEHQANFLTVGDRVKFLGYIPVPEIYEEFADAQVFCGLSRSEAFGNVFVEAQAAECAVVATSVGGIPDIVENGVNGILVPPDDPEAAADAITKLLDNETLRSDISKAGVQNAQKYDWSVLSKRYAEVYDQVLA